MDFEQYKNQAPYPDKPQKPTKPYQDGCYNKGIGTQNRVDVPALHRKYADEYEAYEKALEEYKAKRNQWNQVQSVLNEKFKADALEEAGLTGHAQADKCWEKAWSHGHADGNEQVIYWLHEFAGVLP